MRKNRQASQKNASAKAHAGTAHYIKPKSGCTGTGVSRVVRDKSNGRLGIILRVNAIRWIDSNHSVVDSSHYQSGRSASASSYYLERNAGGWKVTKDEL